MDESNFTESLNTQHFGNDLKASRRQGLFFMLVISAGLILLVVVSNWVFKFLREPDETGWFLLGLVLFIAAAFTIGIRYIQFFYGLKKFNSAYQYLIAILFGHMTPFLVIDDGKMQIKPEQENLLERVGGPGFVLIMPGNLVLFQGIGGATRVKGEGFVWVSKFETIKEIIKLDEYNGSLPHVVATTKDGIRVKVQQVSFRYRLFPGEGLEPSMRNPYPYSEEAVRNMVYNRSMSSTGPTSWDRTVGFSVDGAITDYINRHSIDDLTAPGLAGSDPRGEICEKLRSESVNARLKEIGAELIWFDIGHFEIPEQVSHQHLNVWQAPRIGDAEAIRAFGEAQRQSYQELGRAEAQAEILMSIVHALEDVNAQKDSKQNLRNVILMRTAQLLEAMSDGNHPPEEIPARRRPQRG